MKTREIVLGNEFEETRVKIRKDKGYFARLENREIEVPKVKEEKPKVKEDSLTILPLGLK